MILADIVLPAELAGVVAAGGAAWCVWMTRQVVLIRMEMHALKVRLYPKEQPPTTL